MHRSTEVVRRRRSRAGAAAVGTAIASLALTALVPAPARAVIEVAVVGEVGVPGGSAAATLSSAGDEAQRAAAASVRIGFPDNTLAVDPGDCALAPRLGATHALTATLGEPGHLDLAVEAQPIPEGPAPIGDGDLARCFFQIALGAPTGTAALELSELEVRDADGQPLEAVAIDGEIEVVGVIPTVSPTPTEAPPTSTPTPGGPTFTPTATATSTATATAEPTPGLTAIFDRSSDCSIAPPGSARPSAAFLLLPALLLLALRRR